MDSEFLSFVTVAIKFYNMSGRTVDDLANNRTVESKEMRICQAGVTQSCAHPPAAIPDQAYPLVPKW